MRSGLVTDVQERDDDIRARAVLLDALTVASGAIDAACFLAFGRVFAAFMTGNLAFLGMRLAGSPEAPAYANLLVSLASFAAGAYAGARLTHDADRDAVWSPRVTLALATSLLAHAAVAILWLASDGRPSVPIVYLLLGAWAVASGMQAAAVRTLGLEGVTTTAATGTVLAAIGDLADGSRPAAERRRLATMLGALFVGALLGALALVHARPLAPVLPLAIVAAVVAVAARRFRVTGNRSPRG